MKSNAVGSIEGCLLRVCWDCSCPDSDHSCMLPLSAAMMTGGTVVIDTASMCCDGMDDLLGE